MSKTSEIHIQESSVEVQRQTDSAYGAPDDQQIAGLILHVLSQESDADLQHPGVTVRLVENEEIRRCNLQWREIDKATNVLSFPADFPPEAGVAYLGDILICPQVLQTESIAQNKTLGDHWKHILTHGVLHLLGYDHENDTDATVMENREIEILATLGVSNPYIDHQVTS